MFDKQKTRPLSLSDKVLEILPELVHNSDMFSALAAMAEYVYLGYGSAEDITKDDLEGCLEVINNEGNFDDSIIDQAKADTKAIFRSLNLEYVDGEDDTEDEDDCISFEDSDDYNDEDEDYEDDDYEDDEDYEDYCDGDCENCCSDEDDYENDEDYSDEDEDDIFAKNRQATFNTLSINGIYSDYQG